MNLKELVQAIDKQLLALPQYFKVDDVYNLYCLYYRLKHNTATYNANPNNFSNDVVKINSLPWRSKTKANTWLDKNGYNYFDKGLALESIKRENFNIKDNRKKFMKKIVYPKCTYLIDYFYCGKYYYLLAINGNIRKAYAIPGVKQQTFNAEQYVEPDNRHSTEQDAINEVKQLMSKGVIINSLIFDEEPAYQTKFRQFLTANNISYHTYVKNDISGLIDSNERYRPEHSALSIIDRFSRTLRTMIYNLNLKVDNITPPLMLQLIDEYNSSPTFNFNKNISY